MKPLLAQWLDEHLPEIVERVVQQEVERAARSGGGRRR
jgi:cell pole-organizing protein PopZ